MSSNLKPFNLLLDALVALFVIYSIACCWGVKHKKIKGNIAYQITNKIDEIFDKIILQIFAICVVIWFCFGLHLLALSGGGKNTAMLNQIVIKKGKIR